MKSCRYFVLCLLITGPLESVRADPLAEVAATFERLRDQPSYAWETLEGSPGGVNSPGVFKTPYGLARGSVTVERIVPHVQGVKRSDGTTVISAESPRDSGATAVIPPGGGGVVSTPAGWLTRAELQPLLDAAIKKNDPGRNALQIASAALATKRPEMELAALIRDVRTFKPAGDEITGDLSARMAGIVYGPSPTHPLVKDISGSISFQIKDGLIRSYTVRTEATVTIRNVLPPVGGRREGEGRIDESPPMEEKHETMTIINYAPAAVPRIPEAAARKLAQMKPAAASGP